MPSASVKAAHWLRGPSPSSSSWRCSVARIVVVTAGVVGIAVGIYSARTGAPLIDLILSFMGYFAGGLLGLFLLGMLTERARGTGAFIGATGVSMAEQADLVREHGDRISHVHLNDTRMDGDDEHLPVGVGKLDFAELAAAMVETGWSGTCTHEVFTFDDEPRAFGKRRFDRLLGG